MTQLAATHHARGVYRLTQEGSRKATLVTATSCELLNVPELRAIFGLTDNEAQRYVFRLSTASHRGEARQFDPDGEGAYKALFTGATGPHPQATHSKVIYGHSTIVKNS